MTERVPPDTPDGGDSTTLHNPMYSSNARVERFQYGQSDSPLRKGGVIIDEDDDDDEFEPL